MVKITVKTGDMKFSGTDNFVSIILHDSDGKVSKKLTLDNRFKNDFQRGKLDEFTFKNSDLQNMNDIIKIELLREGPMGDDWFVEYVLVNDGNNEHSFPIHRWVPLNNGLVIKEYDSYLPFHDHERKDFRRQELERKRLDYQLESKAKGLPPQVTNMPKDESFSDDYRWDIKKRQNELFIQSKIEIFQDEPWKTLDDIKSLYGTKAFPDPHSITGKYDWKSDEYFAEQRLTGCNPTQIRLCTEIPENFAVTSDMLVPLLQGKSLDDALSAKQLFIINYKITEGIKQTNDKLVMCSPMCLFYLNDEKQLKPIAIQLFQKPSENNPVFTPLDPPNTWLLAKMWFNNTDANVHQAISHLGYTHIVMESFALATHRQLSPSHPLFRLLAPHFLYLIAINWSASTSLVGEGEWIDLNMTMGRLGTFDLIARKFPDWRLDVQGTLPKDIEERGVADPNVLPYYPYRDDALLTYKAIEKYVQTIIQHQYTDHESGDESCKGFIERDHELQAWVKELTDPIENGGCGIQGVPGNGKLEHVEDLISIVTSVIFVCSVGHASVNFMQYDDYAYPPAYPALMKGKPPSDKTEKTEDDIISALPDKNGTLEMMTMTRILSDRGTNCLGDFEVTYAFDEVSKKALAEFKKDLTEVEKEITMRNSKRSIPYTVLLPSDVPNAISI